MQNYLVDIYQRTEQIINGEPRMETNLLHANVTASKIQLSGHLRYLAAGVGIPLTMKIAIPYYDDVNEMSLVDNFRTREGDTLEEHPTRYRVVYVTRGERRFHLELDLEALRDES